MQKDILAYLAINPAASRKELALHIDNSTEDGIKYNLDRLKKLGYIQREGPAKGGFWEIIELRNCKSDWSVGRLVSLFFAVGHLSSKAKRRISGSASECIQWMYSNTPPTPSLEGIFHCTQRPYMDIEHRGTKTQRKYPLK